MGRRRFHRTIDARRLGEAVRAPAQTWVSAGRIDDDPEAIHFDAGVGWLVDVTFYGSGLEDDEGRPCRVLSMGAPGSGRGEYIPPAPGAEVLVALPAGDPEAGPIALGYLTNEDDAHPPETVNGLEVTPEATTSGPLSVSPFDTEIVVSPHNRREQYAGDRFSQARGHVLEAAEQVKLALRDAVQSYVRGERFVQVLNGWIDAVTSYVTANGEADLLVYAAVNALVPGSITPDQIQAVVDAIAESETRKTAFQSAAVAGDALSSRIKGD